jgi:opacity protein-like surface antigen
MSKKLAATAVLVAAVAATAFTPPATAQNVAGAFGQGRTHFVVTGGRGFAFDETYWILGVGVSYYLIDGLSVGLSYEVWSGDPDVTKVTPSVQYVFHQVPLKPYVGAFFRRTEVEGLEDLDSVGARAGVNFQAGRNAYIGIGAVYESYLDCSKSTYRSCDDVYPEVIFTIAF